MGYWTTYRLLLSCLVPCMPPARQWKKIYRIISSAGW